LELPRIGYPSGVRRLRHIILILTGRASRAELALMEFDMAFEKTTAALEDLKAARDRIVAEVQSLQTAAANVPDTSAVDDATAAAITDVTNSLNGAVPPAA
jgi:hypothetical protein